MTRTLPILLVALGAVAGLAAWAIPRTSGSAHPAASERAHSPVAQGFPGASNQRIFLTPAESAEAARRGLVPPRTRSVLATHGKLAYGAWRWDDAGVPAGPVAIRVDLDRQLVSVFRGPDEIGTAVVVYGANGKETPRGALPILGKTRDYHSITYDAPMPYSLWLRDDGVAIHGSNVRTGRATNGCIGVPVEFAAKVFAITGKGDIVNVVGSAKAG